MDLTLFEDVLVLLEEGSMSRAARRRNITQPAFSRRIQSFETWLGRAIVQRSANRIEIEPALLANTAELQALVVHVQELRRRIAGYAPGRSTVTIAAQHSLILSTLPDFAATARQRYPMINFRVRAANHNDCISLFLSGEASLLMCYERDGGVEMPLDESVIRSLWGRDRLVPVVGGALRFALLPNGAPPADLTAIVYPAGSFFAEMLSRSGTPASGPAAPAFVESAFTAGIKELVLAGQGVGWLPMSLIHDEVQSGALIVCAGDGDTLPLRITLFARPTDVPAAQLCGMR